MAKEPKIVPFGKYELLEKIAVGGMAEIFKARTKGVGGFEKYLAIKRILPHLSENKDFIDMLINEAKIAVMLSHANIVQIYDLGKIDDSYFIAMEYIEGKDLRALMTRCDQIGMPLFIQHAIFIAIEVCKGLEYAHVKSGNDGNELNIVHRDISPQNIMISYEGEVKLTDFGIAKANVNIGETEAGVVKGKYEYMSPEQASGLAVDRRTDIFATGIVLYEMLTGQKPFKGESDLTILERVREAKVDPPSKYNKSIPKKLEKIVLKALAREPGDRYQSATELKDELTRFFYSSTFNFTTSNLAAFMKSIFAEEIKLDVLTDGDATGIGRKPDLGDGNTVSRIFGKPSSDKFRKNGTSASNPGIAIGAVNTTDSNPTAALKSLGDDGPSSSRTLGGEALASIEEEINRILIPGKTNFGKVPTSGGRSESSRPTTAPDGSSLAASSSAPQESTSAAAPPPEAGGSATSQMPREETGARATVAGPRPASAPASGGTALGDVVQSAAMELAMEIEMAMPPASRVGPAPRPESSATEPDEADDDSAEAATEAGRGMSWTGSEDRLDDGGSIDSLRAREGGGGDEPGTNGRNGTSGGGGARPRDDDENDERPTSLHADTGDVEPARERGEDDEPAPAARPEETEDDEPSRPVRTAPETNGSNGRESTIITPRGNTGTGSRPVTMTGSGTRPSSSINTGTGSKQKIPMRAVKERIRGVTVNAPNPDAEGSSSAPAARIEERTAAAPAPPLDEAGGTDGGSRADRIESGARNESTVIGRKPVMQDGTEPGSRRQPSLSRTLNRPPEPIAEPPRREPPRPRPRASEDSDFLTPGADYDAPLAEPPPRRPVRSQPIDEQADLYPAPGSQKRVQLHPAVLMLLAAIVFFAGVVLAKLM